MSRNHFKFFRLFLSLALLAVLLCLGQGNTLASPEAAHPELGIALSPDAPDANIQVSLLGQLGGSTYAVAVMGSANYAFIGVGPRLVILNISDPTHPTFLGQTEVLPDFIEDIAISGDYAYLADSTGGLRIINFAVPSTPVEVGFYDTSGYTFGVAVSYPYAYIADGYQGLRIIDISIPASPSETGFLDTAGYAYDVAVSGSYAYVADSDGGLRLIRVSTPSAPVQVNSFNTSGYAYGVAVDKYYAYVADWTDGLRIISIATPSNIYEVGSYVTPDTAMRVSLYGNYAFVADTSSLIILDVSTPTAPTESGSFYPLDYVYSVAVSGMHAFIADGSEGMRVIDYQTLPDPFEAGYFDSSSIAYNVSLSGNYAYLATGYSGMQIVNITNPALLSEVTYLDTPDFATNVETSGNYAYIADGESGLWIIDKTNPAAPSEVGSFDTTNYAYDVAVSAGFAYVADWYDGLRIIDLKNPSSPVESGYYITPGYARGVVVSGIYAYIADDFGGLRVIDKSDPSAPSEVGYFDTVGEAYDVAVSGLYAYVAEALNGLRVINISDPSAPSEAGAYNTTGKAEGVKVSGSYAYVADGESGLRIIDVTKPSTPSEAGFYDTLGYSYDVAISGNTAFVADGSGGLVVLRLCAVPTTPAPVAPVNGSTTSSDNTPTFDWNAGLNASEYQIQIDDNSDFSSPVATVNTTATEYTPAVPLDNATYYWRVRGHNLDSGCDAYGLYSLTWNVTVAIPPAGFSKIQPVNNSIGALPSLILSWESSAGATSYQYCLDTTNDNTCSAWTDAPLNTQAIPSGLNYVTTYYWQVRACNTVCTYANSDTSWNFTTNDQYEPDNDPAHATLVTPGPTFHSIVPLGDVDWIKFSLDRELAVFIETSGTGNWDTKLYLYSSYNLIDPMERDEDSGTGLYSYIDRACNVDSLPAGTYYVMVEAPISGNIPVYQLQLTTWGCEIYLPSLLKNYVSYFEGPFEAEPNDSAAQANGPIRSGQVYHGYPDDENDYFYFTTQTSGTIIVDLTDHSGGGVQMLLYYQTVGNTVGIDNAAPYQIVYNGAPGTYYVRIYTASGFNSDTPYALRVTYP